MFQIVLYQPQIAPNTGNIIRLCANTGTKLNLIKPYGFSFSDKYIKRAGLDYHSLANINQFDNFNSWLGENNNSNIYIASSKAKKYYTDYKHKKNSFLMFI